MSVLYHGSNCLFEKFSTNVQKRRTNNETNSLGIWLTNDIDSAIPFSISMEVRYVESTTQFWNDGSPKSFAENHFHKGYIYFLHLNNVKLYEFKSTDANIDSFDVFMTFRDQFCHYIGANKGQRSWKERFVLMNKNEANQDFVDYLSNQGYDGFVIRNTEYDSKNDKKIDQYCIFNSDKIIIDNIQNVNEIIDEDTFEKISNEILETHYRLY